MTNASQTSLELLNQEDGQAMVEYPLIIAMVSVAAIAALSLLGPAIISTLTTITNKL